ncbi:glycosyltransferase family 9 protein [Sediminibacterium soli]|uniref:glycosyltransferase family 9 protein n=1 Tax=Sediminibacterium soli TaxID=2698829 RepID=UPI00137A0E42|nr:glycosyltransferase family 9 protein [Sediminibacterium soli]NCI46113.1 glycosyltransferase family 9 protein [Sediminibacterium soli]
MQKILVVQTAFIGDVVLATGLLEKLHVFYPDAHLDILVRKGNEALFKGHPFLRQALVWNKQTAKYRHLWQLIRKIQRNKYDLVVNVQRFGATGLLTALSGAKHTIGFDKNPFSFLFSEIVVHVVGEEAKTLHEIERNHQLIRSLTDEIPGRPALYPSPADKEAVAAWKKHPYICIAPASVWFTKQFPAEQWIEFIGALPGNIAVYLLGAPGDNGLCEQIRTRAIALRPQQASPVVNLAGQLGFLASAALQQDAEMNYVNDSAPMHFASSVNAPVTAVYCSTVPAFGFGPLSRNSHIVETPQVLACRPCGLHGRRACPLGHFHCATHIRTEQLLATMVER